MVHLRLNGRETNPNTYINFISALPAVDATAQEDARQLLRALAAQVKPVMKAHGFVVNNFEEYEYNRVFAGRNWNNGEVIELVLRGADGHYAHMSWLMSTLCHELAHIKHMDHGPAFQALWARLRNEVRDLQRKGYYGDGYWSSGQRLADSATVGAQGFSTEDLPEYMCGGAQTRKRPTAMRRRRARRPVGPSLHTGAQTAKRRKAGRRVTAQNIFRGEGKALNEDFDDEDQKKAGAGFRKQAGSKRAREERALAAERRLLALQNPRSTVKEEQADEDEDDSDDEVIVSETDQQRRQTLLESMDQPDLDSMKSSQINFSDDFAFPSSSSLHAASSSSSKPAGTTTIEISSDDEDKLPEISTCDVQLLPHKGSTTTTNSAPILPKSDTKGKGRATEFPSSSRQLDLGSWLKSPPKSQPHKSEPSYGDIVQDEIDLRKKESLGLVGPGHRLGGATSVRPERGPEMGRRPAHHLHQEQDSSWSCNVCTLSNNLEHLSCAACGTPKGESVWSGDAP